MELKTGAHAPAFELTDRHGTTHTLKSIAEEYIVLYFYPKDDTPGCTVESVNFERDIAKFKALNAAIVGISGGTDKTKEKFCKKHGLDSLILLSDPDFATAKAYESFGEKKFMGRTYNGIFRNTFVLDGERKIAAIFQSVSPEEHSAEVLEFLKSR